MSEIGYGPLEAVDGPPPVAPPYGLVQAAAAPASGVRLVPDTDARGFDRWGNGVEVWPAPPGPAFGFQTCQPGSGGATKEYGENPDNQQFDALTVYVPVTCTARSIGDQAAYRARAVEALAALESSRVATEFLTGDLIPLNPHLSGAGAVFPNGNTATSIVNGIALLENLIGETGRIGVIHISPAAATVARNHLAVDERGGVIRTINGNLVVPDFGYAVGADPDGHPAATGTQEWIYATGPVDVRRSDVVVIPETPAEALDRGLGATDGRVNSITYRAERLYLVDWDVVLHAAVLVDLCQTTPC